MPQNLKGGVGLGVWGGGDWTINSGSGGGGGW